MLVLVPLILFSCKTTKNSADNTITLVNKCSNCLPTGERASSITSTEKLKIDAVKADDGYVFVAENVSSTDQLDNLFIEMKNIKGDVSGLRNTLGYKNTLFLGGMAPNEVKIKAIRGTIDNPEGVSLEIHLTTGLPSIKHISDEDVAVNNETKLERLEITSKNSEVVNLSWKMKKWPSESNGQILVAGDNTGEPTVKPDVEGEYILQVEGEDEKGSSVSSEKKVNGRKGNMPPKAEISTVDRIRIGKKVELDGSGSTDPEGAELIYRWTFVNKPEGSASAIGDYDQEIAYFTPDIEGNYIVRLTVGDGDKTGVKDAVIKAALNIDAVGSKCVDVGQIVSIYAPPSTVSGATYMWEILYRPDDSASTVVTGMRPNEATFKIDKEGFYSIAGLTVGNIINSNYIYVYDATKYFFSTSCQTVEISGEITEKIDGAKPDQCSNNYLMTYTPRTIKDLSSAGSTVENSYTSTMIGYSGGVFSIDDSTGECKSKYSMPIPYGTNGDLSLFYLSGCYRSFQKIESIYSRYTYDYKQVHRLFKIENENILISKSMPQILSLEEETSDILEVTLNSSYNIYIGSTMKDINLNISTNVDTKTVNYTTEAITPLILIFIKPDFSLPSNSEDFPNECTIQ